MLTFRRKTHWFVPYWTTEAATTEIIISVCILRSFCMFQSAWDAEGASETTLARSLTKNVHLCTHLLTVCLKTLLLREENQRIPLTTGTYVLKHHLNFQKNQSRPCQVLSTFCQRRFRNLRKFTKIYENLRKFTKKKKMKTLVISR